MLLNTPILHAPGGCAQNAFLSSSVHRQVRGLRSASMKADLKFPSGSDSEAGTTRTRMRGSELLLTAVTTLALFGVPFDANADLVPDKYGRMQQRICPVAYFPCYQEGNFCFRPIYCEGQFSPEGLLNASIIFAGILGPLYSIWRRKTGRDPDPNTPEGKAFYAKKWEGYLKDNAKAKEALMPNQNQERPKSRFFGKNAAPPAENGDDAE